MNAEPASLPETTALARHRQGPKYETLMLALLAAVVFLIYADTLAPPFILDDISSIRDNPHIRVPSLSLENLAWAGFNSPESRRPVANISFALNYYFDGYNPFGFHLVNILIHIAAGLCLYALAKATLSTPALRPRYGDCGWIPFFTAFIWLVHPIQTQSVSYLVQRMNSLAAMFYVLSMLFYVKFRLASARQVKWSLFSACVLTAILAFGTKEISATLPLFIILYEWYFFQELSWKWARRHLLLAAGLLSLTIILALAYLDVDPMAKILSYYKNRSFTPPQRVLTELRVVIFYIGLLLWPNPSRLNLEHDFSLSYSLTNPLTTLFALTAIIALIILAILIARREPLLSFGLLWFFGNLVIESSVIGLELVFEHRNYLPSMFVILAVVSLVFRYLKPVWLAAVSLCVVGTLLTAWTFERNRVWADEITLYRDCAEKSPGKARPHNNLGAALARRGLLAEAIEQYQAALRINPQYADAHYNLGYALAKQGNLTAAIQHFAEALRINPRSLKAHNNMGVALVLLDRIPEALDYFNTALRLNPTDAAVHNNLGYALMRIDRLEDAARHFSRALELDAGYEDARRNLEETEKKIREKTSNRND